MKILIGASDSNLFSQSRDWLLKSEFHEVVTDLESWILSKEDKWGECFIFIEITLPRPEGFTGSHGQLDMLVAFTHRAAICEMKGHGFEREVDIDECKRQTEGEVKWTKELAYRSGHAPWVAGLIFLYRLAADDVRTVKQRLIANNQTKHIWCAGARRALRGRTCDDQPLYLPQALEAKLSECPPHITGLSFKIQQFFANRLTKAGTKVHRFNNFDEARAWLKVASPRLKLHNDEWHVAGLRRGVLEKAERTIKDHHLVEFVGAPGVGKTTCVKELIGHYTDEIQELHVRNCFSVHDVCNRIHSALYGDDLEGLGEQAYTQRLVSQSVLFWISGYDECSAASLNYFFGVVRLLLTNGDYKSRWIIESRRPLSSLQDYSHTLSPLNNPSISHILEKIESGGAFSDMEIVVDKAEGNPARAIRLWQSQNESQAQALSDIAWFVEQLTLKEKSFLPALCMAASESPVGISERNLVQLGAALCDDLTTEVKSSIDSLLLKLEVSQLADVTRLNKDTFGDLLRDIIPERTSLTVINRVAPELISSQLEKLSAEDQQSLRSDLHDTLLNTDSIGSLGYVTLMINLGDLEPFFRSSFRFTSLGTVIEWLERLNWKAPNDRQKYLRRALRILWKMNRNWKADARSELGEPSPSDDVQLFARDFVVAREMTVKPLSSSFVLAEYLAEVRGCEDVDLQVAMYMSLTTALRNSSRYEEVWSVLHDLPERFAPNTTARGLAVYQTLEFLNATKARKGVIEDHEAYPIIHRLALELIEQGLMTENLQSVCDGLFNFVRSQEMRKAKTSFKDVLGYLSALRFIEEAPGTRPRQRLKILLTQGSIYRHYCRQSHLEWDEFAQHLEDGMDYYIRAIRSGTVHQHSMHMLNAASYMTSFCVTSLRFRDIVEAREVIAEKCKDVLAMVDKLEKTIAASRLLAGELTLFNAVKRNYPILLYVSLVSGVVAEEREPELQDRFASMVSDASTRMSSADVPRFQKIEEVRYVLNSVTRALDYGRMRERERNLSLVELLRHSLLQLLKVTKNITESGKRLKEWERFYKLCQLLVERT